MGKGRRKERRKGKKNRMRKGRWKDRKKEQRKRKEEGRKSRRRNFKLFKIHVL